MVAASAMPGNRSRYWRNIEVSSKERLLLCGLSIIVPESLHSRLDWTHIERSGQYISEETGCGMSKDLHKQTQSIVKFQTHALGQQNLPEEAGSLFIIWKNGSKIIFSQWAWKSFRKQTNKQELSLFSKFPTININYNIIRETILKKKNRKH